jgi:hypothetical protein
MTISAQDIREFQQYLDNCTDTQVLGVFRKETDAGREEYAELAHLEAIRRGIANDH